MAQEDPESDGRSHDEKMRMGKKQYEGSIQKYVDTCGGAKLRTNPDCSFASLGYPALLKDPQFAANTLFNAAEQGLFNTDDMYYLKNSGYTSDQILQDINDTWSTKTKVALGAGAVAVGGGVACAVECPRPRQEKSPSPP